MKKKMKNAPIYYSLAQVRFNRLAAIADFVPKIQDSLRRAGFPDYQSVETTHVIFGVPQGAKPTVITRYLFLNEKQTAGFILDESWLSFQTADYDTFEPFLTTFLNGLSVIHREAGGLSYSERVGLRVLDAIVPTGSESVYEYLHPSVIGLAGRFQNRDLVHSISETRTTLEDRVLVSRVVIHKQSTEGPAFPEDLQPTPLKPMEKFAKLSGTYGILDTDGWVERRETFNLAGIEKILRACHADVGDSFDLTVTPYALKVWE
jgi:uncharacterized protein (TIGR04255 family)